MNNHRFYDAIATAAGFLNERLSPGEHRLVERLILRGGRLLDVGCGSGRLHDYLVDVDELVGVDYAAAQLSLYRQNYHDAVLVHADAVRLPFLDATFDSVLLGYHMIESVLPASSRSAAIGEAARVLRRHGHLYLTRHVRRNYRLKRQLVDYLAGKVEEFGDVRGRGANHAGGVSLEGFTMHVPCDAELRRMTSVAALSHVESWDFDTGGRRRRASRAIVQAYLKG